MNQPKECVRFSDENLNTVFSQYDPVISGFTANVDTISNDIRALERYLESSAFRVAVAYCFADNVQHFGPELWVRTYETIEWTNAQGDEEGKGGRWRVMYRLSQDGHVSACDGPRFLPLIETRVEVRIRAAGHLAAFLKQVGAKAEEAAAKAGEADEPSPF